MRLSDTIEQFIKNMISEEPQAEVDLKRNELAAYFHCAPSQINYVLSTRFTPDHGYVTSSQRGGGGYPHPGRPAHVCRKGTKPPKKWGGIAPLGLGD